MSDTLLILHVKGTEADTTTLPRHAIQSGITDGRITSSQLIWSTKDNAWKQVREMPEFIPVEHLILHVKGTEADTRELPKPAVRTAISQGQITQTQLIWSPVANTWKQAKDFPDLVPTEHLILHVKGTEAETRELPKPEVKAAISRGQITQTQLIWSPVDNSWKQAKEFPDLLPSEHLILHVKGTEAETKELPKRAIRTAISKGEITHSQLIWSTSDNSWKQVRELPELLPSQKLAPAPKRAVVTQHPVAVEAIIPESPGGPVARAAKAAGTVAQRPRVAGTGTVPRIAVQAPPKVRVVAEAAAHAPQGHVPKVAEVVPPVGTAEATTPQVRVASAAGTPQVRVAAATVAVSKGKAVAPVIAKTTDSLKVKEDPSSHPLKWICIGLGVLIVLVLGLNYFLVDRPLVSSFAQTPYSHVTVYAHLGAFMQPNVMVIHIPASSKITPDNLTDLLVALAASTPQNPITRDFFGRVALTSGWTAQYSFAGNSWKELGDMSKESETERKNFILTQLCDGTGQPLVPESTLSEYAQQIRRDQIWAGFEAHFTALQ